MVRPRRCARSAGPRSSNLRLRKEFTEADRDRFLDDAFGYIRLFFENSLQEIEQRNPEIAAAFRTIDANRFTAVVYRHGKAETQCLIRLERSHRSSGEIQFSVASTHASTATTKVCMSSRTIGDLPENPWHAAAPAELAVRT